MNEKPKKADLSIEEIDDIIIKMHKGEKVKCPKCGETLLGSSKQGLKALIHCPNNDFEVYLDFKRP